MIYALLYKIDQRSDVPEKIVTLVHSNISLDLNFLYEIHSWHIKHIYLDTRRAESCKPFSYIAISDAW